MAENKIFVGRKAELEQFLKVLEDPRGQAVLVVGQAGMGKTWLVNKFCEMAESHPKLKCGWVRYEVTPTDSVDSTMALMMDNAFEAASTESGSFDKVPERKRQWWALLKIAKLIPAGKWVGKALGDKVEIVAELWKSLQRNPQRNTRAQFLERLRLISKRMPQNGRAIFIIDPEKYMQEKSDQSWAIVVKDLPERIKFVFGQRPEDVLVESETFDGLDNVVSIPDEDLDVLEEEAVDELLDQRVVDLEYSITEVRKVLDRYEGYPYALGAAFDLLKAGIKLEELPDRPEPIKFAEVQWKEVCKRGKDAICLLKAYAILEVGVPDDVVKVVSNIDSDTLQHLLADKYLAGLLRDEGEGKRIYHAILADFIIGQISEAEKKEYHGRAVEVYKGKLRRAKKEKTKPDELAAMRLPEHVLAAEDEKAFVDAFVSECYQPLKNLGFLDVAIGFSERTLKVVKKGSEEEANVTGNLGLIYMDRGELDKSEKMHNKALEINKKLGRLEGMASQYGNLGLIYYQRGELDKSEEMHKKSLEIEKKLGRLEGMASDYGNLGLIYMDKSEFDKAEDMFLKILEIHKKLGSQEGLAKDYGNLGGIYQSRGELDKAEEMLREGLKIDEKLGRLGGMAAKYGNLGLVYKQRGDAEKAQEYWETAVELYKKIGVPQMVEKVEKWIDALNQKSKSK